MTVSKNANGSYTTKTKANIKESKDGMAWVGFESRGSAGEGYKERADDQYNGGRYDDKGRPVLKDGKPLKIDFTEESFNPEKQKEFCDYLIDVLAFDRNSGLMKESVHPFTWNTHPTDVRFTTRYLENYVFSSIFAAIHELGHATYEQQVDDKWNDTGLNGGASMGVHESQSRFYENVIGRSKAFWETHYPKFKELFPEETKDITVDDFVHSIKMTSFSCAPDFDEHPYTSILWFIEDGKINAQSSDKHRISVFGKKYELQQSYLFSKTISDVILYYIEKIPGITFSLYNSKIYLTWDGGELSCSLEKNTYEKIFSNFNQFFSDQFFLTLELQKDALVKSVKFVSSIANSHMISLTLDINKLVISANSNEKNAVVDTIEIENYEVLSVSYVSSHLIRVLDLLDSKKLKLNFIKHNDFILLMLEAENFKHILFPMD